MLENKNIILGISGSIAAYKSALLTRLLIRSGAEVQVIMTQSATGFISPLTLSTLSRNKVHLDVNEGDSWDNHVELGLWADAFLIAPATATTLARLSSGLADNMLAAVYLSARCPVFFAPAMDLDMWKHPATQENVHRLTARGDRLIPVESGELASGLVGEGRMAEPEHILSYLKDFFENRKPLPITGKKVLITAGPTYEPIDPVRFIGNRSSGKMGIALADAAAKRGAEVNLILGPSAFRPTDPTVQVTSVESAREMYAACRQKFPQHDLAILAAAVADYRPEETANQKIKKTGETLDIHLRRNPDIAASLGADKRSDQLVVGFALETQNALENAQGKLERKNLDAIVLNSLEDEGAGFGGDTNKISFLAKGNKPKHYELKSKTETAEDILDAITELWIKK